MGAGKGQRDGYANLRASHARFASWIVKQPSVIEWSAADAPRDDAAWTARGKRRISDACLNPAAAPAPRLETLIRHPPQ